MHGRVEATAGALARLERELHDSASRARRRARRRRFSRESSESGGSATSPARAARTRPRPRRARRRLPPAVDQELDVGAHRGERAPQHHEVRVTTSGGRVTTRTERLGRRSAAPCRGGVVRRQTLAGRRPSVQRRSAGRDRLALYLLLARGERSEPGSVRSPPMGAPRPRPRRRRTRDPARALEACDAGSSSSHRRALRSARPRAPRRARWMTWTIGAGRR